MPHHFVKQPNGRYAIWSTIVDDFTIIDCSQNEAIDFEMQFETRHCETDYPGGIDAFRASLIEQFQHIDKSGIAYDWAGDWSMRVRTLERLKQSDTLDMIDKLGLPRRMKRSVSPLACERYWRWYWRNKCEKLEWRVKKLQAEIEASVQAEKVKRDTV